MAHDAAVIGQVILEALRDGYQHKRTDLVTYVSTQAPGLHNVDLRNVKEDDIIRSLDHVSNNLVRFMIQGRGNVYFYALRKEGDPQDSFTVRYEQPPDGHGYLRR